jgi:uncharacterized membrane protein
LDALLDVCGFEMLVMVVVGWLILSGIFAIVGFRRTGKLSQRLHALESRLGEIQRLLKEHGAAPPEPTREVEPAPPAAAAVPMPELSIPKKWVEMPPAAAPVGPAAIPPPPPSAAPPIPEVTPKRSWDDIEKTIGKRWMTYLGAGVLFLAAAFFIKYAFDSGWINPTMRVALGLLAGIAVLVLGDSRIRRHMMPLGQGLIGLGLAVLFLSIFAGHSFYDLIPRHFAFAGFVAAAALGMTLAVLHNALGIAFFAVLGAMLTPVLVSTGVDARDALFSYLALLDLAVLGVAFFRRWRVLDLLAFIGTVFLFGAWFVEYYKSVAWLPTTLWIGVFFLLFLPLPFVYHLRLKTPVSVDRFIMALGNALIFFGFAYAVLHRDHSYLLGFVALFMAACYLSLGTLARRRATEDRRSLFGFVTLAVAFLTLAVPLHLRMHGITLAWAVEGPVLLYLGYRFKYQPVRAGGLAILVLAVLRLFTAHWPLHHGVFVPFFNAPFASALALPLAGFAYAYLHRRHDAEATTSDRALRDVALIGAGLLLLATLHHEISSYGAFATARAHGWRMTVYPFITAAWALGAAAYLRGGWRARLPQVRLAGLLFLAIAWCVGIWQYESVWPEGASPIPFFNGRFATNLLVLGVLVDLLVTGRRRSDDATPVERRAGPWLAGIGLVALLLLLSLEVYLSPRGTGLEVVAAISLGQTLLSVTWGLYAIAMLVIGFWRRVRALRLGALVLFGATLLKLVAVDMSDLEPIFRIFAFLAMGVLLIGASYLYHRVERRLLAKEEPK